MEESIINSRLFKKLGDSDSFYSISDLIKQIYDDLLDNRTKILDILNKTMSDSEDLKEAIKEFNEISELPNITIFGDIPIKIMDSLNNNVQSQIQLLNAIQKLQANWIKRQEANSSFKGKTVPDDDFNMNDFIDVNGKGSEFSNGVLS